MGLSHCWQDGLVMVRDKDRRRRGHNDQSCQGHQCREIMLTGESQFHISIPLWIEPRSLMTGSKGLTHWTSETVCECSEIAGSPLFAKCNATSEYLLQEIVVIHSFCSFNLTEYVNCRLFFVIRTSQLLANPPHFTERWMTLQLSTKLASDITP